MQYVLQVSFQKIMAHMGDCKWMSWLPVLVVSCSECLSYCTLTSAPAGQGLSLRPQPSPAVPPQTALSLLHPASELLQTPTPSCQEGMRTTVPPVLIGPFIWCSLRGPCRQKCLSVLISDVLACVMGPQLKKIRKFLPA